MRTLLALVAAAAMIAAALYARGELPGAAGGPGGGLIGEREPLALICVPELRAACDALEQAGVEVTVEEAGVTAGRLASGDAANADAWLTLRPWDGIVAEARGREGFARLSTRASITVARSPLVHAVYKERGAVLDRRCKSALTWKCVARVAGGPWDDVGGEAQWGRVQVGFTDPAKSATGLLVLGQAASDVLGTTKFSTRDFDRAVFEVSFDRLADGLPDHGTAASTPFKQQLQFGAGRFDVVGTTEAEAAPLLAKSAQRRDEMELRYPATVVTADAVLASLRDGDGAQQLQDLMNESGSEALAAAGWRVKGQPAAPGVPALPEKNNLPSPGVLDALRGRWGEIAR